MGLMLDTSVLISSERGRFNLEDFIEKEAPMEDVFISSISASELLHGVHRAVLAARSKREMFVEAVLRETPILPFDLPCARRHAELWAALEASGKRIGAHDMLIAATGLRFGLRLATLNEKEFSSVEGLTLANVHPYIQS